MSVQKWVFEDEVTDETWTFVRNPFEMASPAMPRRTVATQHGFSIRRGDMPFPWSFRGNTSTSGEYDTMLAWSQRENPIRITDHLGRTHRVIPQRFDAAPRRSRLDRHWRFTYTFSAIYLERL